MSIRTRLVAALSALFTVGMALYGVVSYQAFRASELARLDEQVRNVLPVAERELLEAADPFGRLRPRSGPGPDVVVTPGTYAELRDPAGVTVAAIQVADAQVQPDLSELPATAGAALTTVPSRDGSGDWRVAVDARPDGSAVIVAVPVTALQQVLARLIVIGVVASIALVAVLGAGAWLVLRSGLRPLERIAATARTVGPDDLDRRVPVPSADTEVRQVAASLNAMLDELEVAFAEREATEGRLRRFLSDASHELRTPLTSIQGYAELLRLDADGGHVDRVAAVGRIEAASHRMAALVEDLLALARLDEAAPTERGPVDLAILAAETCSDAAAVEPDRPITLDAPRPVTVHGDADQLRRAIGNLVANALRHTPATTPVEVAAHADATGARLTVRDHGPGLDHSQLERVFDRFWRADPSRGGPGTGLGLSIVRAVAASHDGEVAAGNAAEGGAVFTLRLPSPHDDAPPPPPPPHDREAHP